MQKMIDFLFEYDKRLISPIWDREAAFKFTCWGYIGFAEALGFTSYQATDKIRRIREDSLPNASTLRQIRQKGCFNQQLFDEELGRLQTIKTNTAAIVGGGCFGPLSIAGAILGMERMIELSIDDPGFVEGTVAYVTDHIIRLAQTESSLGMDFFWIAEPVASLFSPRVFERFCGQYLKAIFSSVPEPGFLHVCGKTIKHTQAMVETGAEVLSIDYVTDIGQCIRMVPQDVVIMGNLNPLLLRYGKPDEIVAECDQINGACKNYKNFIFSSGCIVPEGMPPENGDAMTRAVKNYKIHTNDEYRIIRKLIASLLADDWNAHQIAHTYPQEYFEIACKEAALIQKYRFEV